MVSENPALRQLPFKCYRENGPWHCKWTNHSKLRSWTLGLGRMSHFKLPSSWQASLQSIPNRCLSPTSISRKEQGLIDAARMTYITRQASRGRKHPPVEMNVLFQEDNVRPSFSHISDGYHSMPTHVTAHIHQCQRGLLLFPTKKETVTAWQLSIINFIFLFE